MTDDRPSDLPQLSFGDVAAYIHGDLTQGRRISALDNLTIKKIAAAGEPYQLCLSDLVRVLRAFRAGIVTTVEVKHWAAFVWQGDFSLAGAVGPFASVTIDWEPRHSELIAELLDPLHSLGDPGQNQPTPNDLDLMLLQSDEALNAN
jgi:hypothetical protein